MIRILQIVNNMHRAGLETMLMNYYRNIDRSKVQFDFLMHREDKSDYDDEILTLGGRIYRAPRLYPQNYKRYFSFMRLFFKEHPEYKIVHSHIDSMSYLPLLAAKKANIPFRIAHSHNTSTELDFKYPLKEFFRFNINRVCTHRLACGNEAGKYLFADKEFGFIPNAIDSTNFYFDPEVRKNIRNELGLNEAKIIGHVGRFVKQKNQIYLLYILKELIKLDNHYMLMLIGTGPLKEKIERKARDLNLQNNVIFLGNRNDVNNLYQVMDYFALPSLFEGIPVVGIESQFMGLPCYFSESISQEVSFTDNVYFINKKESPKSWANIIFETPLYEKRTVNEKISQSIYNIKNSYKILENYYVGLESKL